MGMLPRRCRCPHCGGKVKKDAYYAEVNCYHYRCRRHDCHLRVHRLHGHPLLMYQGKAISINLQMR
eukprot:3806177-Amphidinium_carterae.1